MTTTSAATRSNGRRSRTIKRGAFTLLELLTVIAILGLLTAVAVISVARGQGAARMKGSVRDVFATVRIARSTALVTQQPCVITFSTEKTEDGCSSKVEIDRANMFTGGSATRARTLGGEWRDISGGDSDDAGKRRDARSAGRSDGRDSGSAEEQQPEPQSEGESMEEILFAPVSAEVFKGICIKVLTEDEELEDSREIDEAKRSMISTFSNVDFLLGKYRAAKAKEKEAARAAEEQNAQTPAAPSAGAAGAETGSKSVIWQTNGRSDPHTIYVYREGSDPATDGWRIEVDRFGAAKIFAPGEDGR